MLLVARYVLRFWGTIARERRDLMLENLALRHQLEVLTRTRRRPPLQAGTACSGPPSPGSGPTGDRTS